VPCGELVGTTERMTFSRGVAQTVVVVALIKCTYLFLPINGTIPTDYKMVLTIV